MHYDLRSELVHQGSHAPIEPLSMLIERFRASLRFENKGKLND